MADEPWLMLGDCLERMKEIPDGSVDLVVTSPPYWGLKDYQCDGQLGMESSLNEYMDRISDVCDELYRVLVRDGCLFLNIGDTYFGYWGNARCGDSLPPSSRTGYNENMRPRFKPSGWMKDKQKALIPFRVAIRLQEHGWIIRNDVVWRKGGFRPERVKNRMDCGNEHVFFCLKDARSKIFTKSDTLSSDLWHFDTSRNPAHPATFPYEMVHEIIKATNAEVVLDPFMGTGTTGRVSLDLGRKFIGIELNPNYFKMAELGLKTGTQVPLLKGFE